MRFEAEFLNQDLYALLGVSSTATPHQVRAAYRTRVRASHPDLNPRDPAAGQRMVQLNRAARVLLDPALRRKYEQLRCGAPSAASRAPRRWYDASDSADIDWGASDPSPVAPVTPAQRAFRRRVRHVGAGLAARAQEALRGVRGEQRLALAALCIALGSALLVWSHPSNAFWTRAAKQVASSEP